jgi:16S rRNA (uracil1498-N3)-methyltransferase
MTCPRFHHPLLVASTSLTLSPSEGHHLSRVLRLGPGDAVELFDGMGTWCLATVTQVDRGTVTVHTSSLQVSPPLAPHLTIAAAVPKGERVDWMVEKLTELGVQRWIPLTSVRSTVDPRGSKLERLRQTALAACKQSRCPYLMEIGSVQSAASLWTDRSSEQRWLAHPGGPMLFESTAESASLPDRLVIAIGPEGGWTDEEVASATAAGWSATSLGSTILRIETAAMAAAAAIRLTR